MKATQKKITQEVTKLNKELESHIKSNHEEQSNEITNLKEDLQHRIDSEIHDKVRVDEIQDALRRLTECFSHKIETLYTELLRTIQSKTDDTYSGLERLKNDILDMQH